MSSLSEEVYAICIDPSFQQSLGKMKNWATWQITVSGINFIILIITCAAQKEAPQVGYLGIITNILGLISFLVVLFSNKKEKEVMNEIKKKVAAKRVSLEVMENTVQIAGDVFKRKP
ncbi:hypothetical protein HDU96_008846 [Phlyctochytrium bullatum]|nr:hypothetical protein HDU96_008846 [Phlyctochytrium bullatum]